MATLVVEGSVPAEVAGRDIHRGGDLVAVSLDQLARLFYKLAVEMDMGMSAVLDCIQVDADYLRKLRSDSVKNVKATNGLLTFEQKAREQLDDGAGAEIGCRSYYSS